MLHLYKCRLNRPGSNACNIISCATIKRKKATTANSKKENKVDLSSALRYSSKLRVTNEELKNLDKDVQPSAAKIDRTYVRDIYKNVIPREIREALRSDSHKKQRETEELRAQLNSSTHGGKSLNKKETHKASGDIHLRKKKVSRKDPKFKKILSDIIGINENMKQAKKLDTSNIPRLSHNLDRTLFSPGIHFLQDPRTRIYNFTPYLKKIVKYNDFNFKAIESFVNVSKDETLLKVAIEQGKRYYSSTSSMTSVMTQFYLFLNNYSPNSEHRFPFPKFSGYSEKSAASVIVQPKGKNQSTKETIYAVESDKSTDNEILLSAMGHCLETLLTTNEEDFIKYTNTYSQQEESESSESIIDQGKKESNVYNYSSFGDFLMRSQLDCYDERLPGNGTFDLKTRAVCAIRYDIGNPDLENNTYQVWKLKGNFESFEREFNDLIRTGTLLKYAFQAKIGQMDGIFIAYHNINSFFGFQYLPLSEIENVFYSHNRIEANKHYGAKNLEDIEDDLPSYVADVQFKMSLTIWQNLLKVIIEEFEKMEDFKGTAFRLVIKSVELKETSKQRLNVFAVPLNNSQVLELQSFSSAYKTSFREDISAEERAENQNKHREHLEAFNKETTLSKAGVLSYYVDVWHLFGDPRFLSREPHPYPRSKSQPWYLRYKIVKCPDSPEQYLNYLSVATGQITARIDPPDMPSGQKDSKSDIAEQKKSKEKPNIFRLYNAIGKARAEKWKKNDSNAIVYEPK